LSYRLITATTDYYNFSFFPRAVFHWNNLSLETVACLKDRYIDSSRACIT